MQNMKKITKLKICNWSLLPLTVAILISGIQLEATHSIGLTSVWIHILIGVLFIGMATYHVYLHFDTVSSIVSLKYRRFSGSILFRMAGE